jgi:hypothetical protein
LPELLVSDFDAILESEDFCGKLRNDARGDVLCGKGNTLRSGCAKGLMRYAIGAFDAAVSEVGGNTLVARSSKLCRSLW